MIYLYLFGTCFHFIYVFMIIGKLKIKENFNRSGGYDYLSNLERFEDILNDIDRHMEIFRNVKFPIKLLCEIN